MVRINCKLTQRRRIELGWTPEELAGEAGLDARTVRRIEQGRDSARLRSAVALAKALKLEVTALVLDDRSGRSEPQGDGDGLAAALTAADGTIQREIVKEAQYVLSILLARSLVLDGKMSGENEEVDRVVAAFRAADSAIQITLSGGAWSDEEAVRVLSLLLTKYGTMFSRHSANGVEVGVDFVQAACDQAKRALRRDSTPK